MTEQTKRFIELRDIIGLRFTCKQCGSALSVPREKIGVLPAACINCTAEWGSFSSDDLQSKIAALIDAMNVIGRLSERKNFAFTLELSPVTRADGDHVSREKG